MAEAPKSYRVVAPYITVKTMTPDGMQIRGLHAGAMVPPDVTPESIGHHVTLGLIEEIPQAQAKAAAQAAEEHDHRAEEARAAAEAASAAQAEEARSGVAGAASPDEGSGEKAAEGRQAAGPAHRRGQARS